MFTKEKWIISIFLIFIFGIAVINITTKDRIFSEQENRYLAQMPIFSIKSFFSGTFTKQFEEYMTDQFVWKSTWLNIKAKAERTILKQENNGIYFGKDGYLLERYKQPGNQLQKNIERINDFSLRTGGNTYLLLAPTSTAIYKNKLPLYAPTYNQKQVLKEIKKKLSSTVKYLDVYDELVRTNESYIYFKTDHHWTMRGAFEAYLAIGKEIGFETYLKKDFNIQTVSKNFYGTYFSKVNDYSKSADYIEVFTPKFPMTYSVNYPDKNITVPTLFESSYLQKKDQYSYFLNGNHSLVKIKSSIKNCKRLAVIKDSYAHIFIPFLSNYFEEIDVID